MTRYTSLAIGAPARLATLRAAAVKHNISTQYARNATWRDVRYATLRSASGLESGLNDGAQVWYCHNGAQFRNERDYSDIITHARHDGWFTDPDGDESAIGIVASLPHGRFIAGYRLTMNDERVYFPEVHDTERDAALMADEHARIIGEKESEYSNRWRDAQDLQSRIDDACLELAREFDGRHSKKYGAEKRAHCVELCADIRQMRAELARDYGDITP